MTRWNAAEAADDRMRKLEDHGDLLRVLQVVGVQGRCALKPAGEELMLTSE